MELPTGTLWREYQAAGREEVGLLRQIDHLVVLVEDLEAAIQAYHEAGFTVVRGGEHPTGTHNALIGFADGSYLELIAFREPNPEHRWYRYLELGGGIVDLCLLSDDLASDVEQLGARGVTLRISEGSRRRPDGVTIAWKGATPADELTGLVPFLIEDVTPRSERVPHGQQAEHANGTRGLAEVLIAVPDLSHAVELWRAVTATDGELVHDAELGIAVHRFVVGPHRIGLAAGGNPLLVERLERLGPGPVLSRLWAWTDAEVVLGTAHFQLRRVEV